MRTQRRGWLVAGILILAALALVAGTIFIAALFFFRPASENFPGSRMPRFRLPPLIQGDFASNGEQIYYTGTSQTGPAITAEMQGMHRMGSGNMACVNCHGEGGRGGTVRMMMGSFEAPDIRYSTLTEEEHEDNHIEHPPYNDETIKRAIIQGLDPSGEPLDWVMPRWDMSEEQLDDLLDYLKSLDGTQP
jgi:cytochrome c oxidase subunit II